MRIKLSQLRRIIKEEAARFITESSAFEGQIKQVLALLPNHEIYDKDDADMTDDERADADKISSEARRLIKAGWSVDDTVEYLSCFQEAGCELDEDEALERMETIEARYS